MFDLRNSVSYRIVMFLFFNSFGDHLTSEIANRIQATKSAVSANIKELQGKKLMVLNRKVRHCKYWKLTENGYELGRCLTKAQSLIDESPEEIITKLDLKDIN